MYNPVGQKFAPNCSISYGLRDIFDIFSKSSNKVAITHLYIE